MKTLRIFVLVLLTCGVTSALFADELRLTNGDRLTGTVVQLADGTLTFKTANGELRISWKDVAALTTERPYEVTISGAAPETMALRISGDPASFANIEKIEAPAPPVQWHGGASAGVLSTAGNTDVNSLRIEGNAAARTSADRYTVSALLNEARTADVQTARNWTASFGYDRFLTKRLFADGSMILSHDRFRDLDLRTAISGGVGYDAWKSGAGTLSVSGGLGYVRENFATIPDSTFAAVHEAAKLDVAFLAKRLQTFHHHDGYFGVTGTNNLFFRTRNGVRFTIVGGLSSAVEWDLDYDRSPSPGRVKTDRTFALTFGYQF
jgi:putative salt-induced outer membrane protein YdiY